MLSAMISERVVVWFSLAEITFTLNCSVDVGLKRLNQGIESRFWKEECLRSEISLDVCMDDRIREACSSSVACVSFSIGEVSVDEVVNIGFHGDVGTDGTGGMCNTGEFA